VKWLLLLLALPALADPLVVPPINPSCMPPLVWIGGACKCIDGSPPEDSGYGTPICIIQPHPVEPACTITIRYTYTPGNPVMQRPQGACSDADIDLALAVILARRLGAP